MGTYSVLLIDAEMSADQQQAIQRIAEMDGGSLESLWDRHRRYCVPVEYSTEADRSFWALDTEHNFGARHWDYLQEQFLTPLRGVLPAAAVYLTTDYIWDENVEWTRAQWLDVAEGRHSYMRPWNVELLTAEAIATHEQEAKQSR